MTEIDSKKEKKLISFFSILPVVVKWIEEDTDLSEEDIRRLSVFHSEKAEFLRTITFEEIIEINTRHKDNIFYGDLINVVISDKGKKWLKKTLLKFQESMTEND